MNFKHHGCIHSSICFAGDDKENVDCRQCKQMQHYITLDIVSDGELFSIQREAPEVFAVSVGPMSMHSALIGTVSSMLEELCSEMWQAEQGGLDG